MMIEIADKKQEENVCGTKQGLIGVYTGRDSCRVAPANVCLHWTVYKVSVENHLKFVSICQIERGSSLLLGSRVDSIISGYNEFYSILSCRSHPV